MTSYRAIEVRADGSLALAERDLLAPEPGQVRIAVEACGICHSDSAAIHPHSDEAGRVPGHEAVGRIDALGAGVRGWNIGDRVGVGFLGGQCGVCEFCRRGDFVGCTDQPWTGITVDGGYAEYMYARASGLVAVPHDLSSFEAAPLLCAGFTTYNALIRARIEPGSTVAVQGIGGLGHLGVQYAKRLGARVIAIARGADKQPLAESLGADLYIDSTVGDVGVALQDSGGADIVLATAASGSSMSPLISGIRRGGQLLVVGASSEPIHVTPISLIFGKVTLVGSLTGSAIENEDQLRFAAANGIRAMSEKATLSGAPRAYERMMAGDARFRMVLSMVGE